MKQVINLLVSNVLHSDCTKQSPESTPSSLIPKRDKSVSSIHGLRLILGHREMAASQ